MGSQAGPGGAHSAGRQVNGLLDLLCIEPVAHELCGRLRGNTGGLNALRATCKAVEAQVGGVLPLCASHTSACGRRTEEAWDHARMVPAQCAQCPSD